MEPHGEEPTSLPLDLIELISSRLLADGVVDYIRFRAVCRDWRSLTASPRTLASQFRPRRWILHGYNDNPSVPCHFHNPFTGRSLRFHLPELESHSIISSCAGLLVLVEEKTYIMRLFNPFTHHMSDNFPPLLSNFGFSSDFLHANKEWSHMSMITVADDSPCPTVMLYIPEMPLYFAKPGDARWQFIFKSVDAITTFKGRFYYANCDGIGMIEVDKRRARPLIPLKYNVYVPRPIFGNFGSDLFLLRSMYEIYRIDLESNTVVKIGKLAQCYALPIGSHGQCVFVPKKTIPH